MKIFRYNCKLGMIKETTLERADFTMQLLMFVTAEKGKLNVYDFVPFQVLSSVVPVILS